MENVLANLEADVIAAHAGNDERLRPQYVHLGVREMAALRRDPRFMQRACFTAAGLPMVYGVTILTTRAWSEYRVTRADDGD